MIEKLVLSLALAIAAESIAQSRAVVGDEDVWSDLSASPVRLNLPAPISKAEIGRYSQILNLSDEQSAYLDFLYEKYREEVKSVALAQRREILQVANAMVGAESDYEVASRFNELVVKQMSLIADLTQQDDKLLSQLESTLAEPQLEALPRVKMHRERWRCVRYPWEVRKAEIDVSQLIETVHLPAEVLRPLEEVMFDYENRVTEAFVKLDKLFLASNGELELLSTMSQFDDAGQPLEQGSPQSRDRGPTARERGRAILKERASLQHTIAIMNDEYIAKVVAQLPGEFSRPILSSYRSYAYPRVFPDSTDPERLYVQIITCDAVEEELRMVLEQRWHEFRSSYDRLCAEMYLETDRWQEQNASTHTLNGWEEHEDKMEKAKALRMLKNEEFVRRFVGLLPDAALVKVQSRIDDWHSLVQRERSKDLLRTRGVPRTD